MKLKTIILFLSLIFLCALSAYGQWDAQVSQYWRAKTYYNPSFVGETNNIDISAMHRMQWIGTTNAPKTTIASAHMPFNFLDKKHGAGIHFFNEKIGLFSNTNISLQYAYKFDFKNGKTLNIGLQGSSMSIDFDAAGIHIPDSDYHDKNDPAKPTGGEDKTIDMGLGISWITPWYYAGFSVTHLWEPKYELDDTHRSFIGRAYYLTGGCNIPINNSLFEMQPSFLVKSDAIVTQIDVTARAEYNNLFSGGVTWRKDDGFVFLLGLKLKNIEAGYSFDLSTSEIAKASSGSHEFSVRYCIPIVKKKVDGRHKSIRVL
ncbi:type IX secretion system membrane protein PorP/SprF [Dysgonomonas sp. 25]|uniref:PorP/SprF family type IX secretion system membrane protein n=1 Tax=Dysgonomonas sp. 25 TaxID=2302933 RepID=UPI0013D50706|nr:type IX secretion system membrane protein PorP/SprF [Dysgonomonas sp. 25]NDV68758.1 type IX secretion system membrane protein PorP/SprF [Dysgonomonas sp. 25]